MNEIVSKPASTQNHAAYLSGDHDFQNDIEILEGSELIKTILETIMLATNTRFAAVARVTAERWVACRTVDEINFGLAAGDEIEIESTFCQSVRETDERVVFEDAATDELYRGHPIAEKFGIVSYASIPIYRIDGSFFGTLCAIDTEPRALKSPRALAMLDMFANIISRALESEEQLAVQTLLIEKERELVKIQEEFVAVLGHDLRNPVAAFSAGLRRLEKEKQTEKAQVILPLMRSSLRRMNELIDNIMMHAKSRLGGGIRISATPNAPLSEQIIEVIEELKATSPELQIACNLNLTKPVYCDAPRIAQAISNLLSNAVNHGARGSIVRLEGSITNGELALTVSNEGEPIPEDRKSDLFRPFERGSKAKSDGLGLGLSIAHSIAAAHNGRIEVSCANGTTTFAFKVPLQAHE